VQRVCFKRSIPIFSINLIIDLFRGFKMDDDHDSSVGIFIGFLLGIVFIVCIIYLFYGEFIGSTVASYWQWTTKINFTTYPNLNGTIVSLIFVSTLVLFICFARSAMGKSIFKGFGGAVLLFFIAIMVLWVIAAVLMEIVEFVRSFF